MKIDLLGKNEKIGGKMKIGVKKKTKEIYCKNCYSRKLQWIWCIRSWKCLECGKFSNAYGNPTEN